MQLRPQPPEHQYRDELLSPASDLPEADEPSGSFVAHFNNAIIWHCDIRRCLKEKVVPVFQNSEKIDFSRLLPQSFADEPELKLKFQGKDDSATLEIVRVINKLLREFRDFYKQHLGCLFEILASQYMMKAFRKAGIEVRLLEESLMAMGKDLVTQLETVPEAEAPACYDYSSLDTWFPIEKCVRELFGVDILKADAVKQLLALDTSTFTDAHSYAGKVELLLKASGLKDSPHETLVVESLFAGLSDEGQKAVAIKYPKLADVLNVTSFLDCVRADSTQFQGRKTDWAKWFKARFKSIDGSAQSSSSSSSAVSAGKKTASPQLAKGKHPRKEARQPCSRRGAPPVRILLPNATCCILN